MTLVLAAIGILLGSGLTALVLGRSPAAATGLGAGGAVLAAVTGLAGSVPALTDATAQSARWAWNVPWGTLAFRIDALSAWFLLPAFAITGLSAVYGARYLWDDRHRRSLGSAWFFYDLLAAGIVTVLVADNAVLFLLAWEAMSLAAYFLVVYDDGRSASRNAGWIFLIAAHVGAAFLLALFVGLAGPGASDLDFGRFRALADTAPPLATPGLAFVLALVGFGAKAGFVPAHVWLPEAHPAAPSHVSALMSAVMIKTGIYGLLRTLTWLGPPPAWWGWVLVAVGLSSGILGVLYALAQHDLKRLLAYHSVENIGIIALGLGAGCLGLSYARYSIAVLGFAGGLLHVVNHAVFKGLLFLGAGAVYHETGTREIDALGGLSRRMPWTSATFLVGSVAIAGLPPLNGFVSEFLVFLGAYRGSLTGTTGLALPLLAVIAGLALIGGLASACFAKAYGIVFLGEARTGHGANAREPRPAMLAPMLILAISCLVLGFAAPVLAGLLETPIAASTGLEAAIVRAELLAASSVLTPVALVLAGFVAVLTALVLLRRSLLARRPVGSGPTWGCGYGEPNPRMQYSASSFAQPLTSLFRVALRQHRRIAPPRGIFPAEASLATETPDMFGEVLYRSSWDRLARGLGRFRTLQHGRVQAYVLYIALTLLAVLIWTFVRQP